ncbi:hypothetical protein HYALB_00002892 [Hymenoscyphus albidus]|uniref:RhoGAP-domain-containing protein n=1 Tax=Hymenoscyphus albidus TaxID=595503 RepID=A0A9N9QCW7_9HELO|nr:hypothetical protein HYALB_00002892 [Hymenoscyphus albidus]
MERSQRKAAPSPLHTSTTASPPTSVTPTRSTFDRNGADHFFASPVSIQQLNSNEGPRSPKERLDDLLASERTFYRPEGDSSTDREQNSEGKSSRFGPSLHDTNAPFRSVSDPVLKPSGGFINHEGTRPLPATAPQHQLDMARPPPRTSSIGSAISSLSSGTHSQKPSQDMKSSGSPDIASLVQTVGSPEGVIQYLLKEKQSQAAQNAQLWRLVDKQRAMILGLNKDLERALKDKERYRKKLKESLAHIANPSPVDSTQEMNGSEAGSIASESRIVEVSRGSDPDAQVSPTLSQSSKERAPSPIDVALAPYPITPPAYATATPTLGNMVEAQHKMPSPTQHAFQQYNPDATEAAPIKSPALDVEQGVPYNASLPPSRSNPIKSPRGPPSSLPALPKAPMSSQSPPTLTLIEPSPNPDEGLRTFPTPPRKAPPAPLNLGNKSNPSSHLRQASATGEEFDSDYDDVLEVDEIPNFSERGRRKTREDDEREREVAAMKQAALRSAQNSGRRNPKSKPTTPKEGTFPAGAEPMPLSPSSRPTVPIAPPDAHLRHLSPMGENSGSLAGVLSDASDRVSERVLSAPLATPGLPVSPRPITSRNNSNHASVGSVTSISSPPLSPRGMAAFPGAVPLSPRAPRQPIPLPPGTPMSLTSPPLSGPLSPLLPPKGEPLELVSPKPLTLGKKGRDSPNDDSPKGSPVPQSPSSGAIDRSLVTEEYPDLLLPPNALPSIEVKVASSRLKPSRASLMFPKNFEEDPVFTLAIFNRSEGRELWRVEKDSSSLARLDQTLKQSPTFTAKTPERSLFSGHAPAKVDARRVALDTYLDEVMNTQMDTASALEVCKYLSTNTFPPHGEDSTPSLTSESPAKTGPGGRPLKNGYLTKRGKNFGGWKARYFVLDGPVFRYFESPGGPHLGTIKLPSAQIGKQQQQQQQTDTPARAEAEENNENQYRHAFLILEPKRKDSSSLVRHVLCAESDAERDEWVGALLQYVNYKGSEDEAPPRATRTRSGSGGSGSMRTNKKTYPPHDRQQNLPDLTEDNLRGVSYEKTKQGSIPQNVRSKQSGTPSPPTYGRERDPMNQAQPLKNISAPKNAQVIQDGSSWGNKPNLLVPNAEDKKARKRSFFGFGSKPRVSSESQQESEQSNLSQMAVEQHGPIRPAFGAGLSEAVRYNHPADIRVELPAVVYRCIEYLDAKNAVNEEGIFRLSGSNIVIKQLRERFNQEGDVNLVTDEQYYDIHAVASLLKLYLRELPSTILTRELHLEFLAVTELQDLNDKIRALNGLVHRLPRANHALLRYLSGFLINIINNADVNKMTVRNVGIVFSPTLNIPAPVFALFLQQYGGIFGEDQSDSPVEVTVSAPPQPQPRQQQNPGRESGFAPMQTGYDQSGMQAIGSFPTMAGPEYGRSTPTLGGPAYDQFGGGKQYQNPPPSKSKRRESSMFGVLPNQRKPSNQQMRPDGRKLPSQYIGES